MYCAVKITLVRAGFPNGLRCWKFANELAREPDAGYTNGIRDARVFLPHPVQPGDVVTIRVPARAPGEPGQYTFAARMVHEGVELFGPTVSGTVTVMAAAGSGDGSDDGDGDGVERGGSGGCAASGGASAWLVVALGVLRVRRRTRI